MAVSEARQASLPPTFAAVVPMTIEIPDNPKDALKKSSEKYATLVNKQNKKKASLLNQKATDEEGTAGASAKKKKDSVDNIDLLLASK